MKRMSKLLPFALLPLVSCALYDPTPKPDYTIRVVQTQSGAVAVPPTCPSWSLATSDPYDNQPVPQFGCATARNLALMVERPEDLTHGREMDASSGVMAVGAVRRYYGNQTRGLLDLDTSPDMSAAISTSPNASSALSGDVTGSSSSSSSSSPAPAAAAPAGP